METEQAEINVSLSAVGFVVPVPGNPAGKFEVDAITVGEGNGWQFTEPALRESLPLWEGVNCLIDHGGSFSGRSVKDLAGVFSNPRWSTESNGIRVDLVTNGPAGKVVEELGRQILADQTGLKVGFSADVVFTARGRQVQKILRVLELCLVYNPARGGAFVRALNSRTGAAVNLGIGSTGAAGNLEISNALTNRCAPTANRSTQTVNRCAPTTTFNKEDTMNEETRPVGELSENGKPSTGAACQDVDVVRNLFQAHQEQAQLAKEAEAARSVRLQMCQYLLESGLAASNLPEPAAEHVRLQFDGRLYNPAELTAAIENARKLVSDLTGGAVIKGPANRVHQMFNSDDQLQAAVDDLLEAPRQKGAENLKAARLSGVKELYMLLTGDRDLYGGYYADRVQLATTADFTGLVKNAMNKIVANQWERLGAAGYTWWQRIVQVEHFESLNDITGTLVGTVGALPSVAEGAEYTEFKVGDSPETASFTKYGGYIPLTLELIDRDDTRKLRIYPRELAKAGIRNLSSLVANVFLANAGIGPTLADGGALFNATAVTTAGGHKNLLTTALSSSEWETVKTAMYVQPLLISNSAGYVGSGSRQAIKPRYLLVPVELELTAMKILYPQWENSANIHSENMQRQLSGDVVVVPEFTDDDSWAAVGDPAIAPGIIIGERFGLMPEIFIAGDEHSPAVFMNDEHRIKVRHYLAVLVQDFRPLHKSNVA